MWYTYICRSVFYVNTRTEIQCKQGVSENLIRFIITRAIGLTLKNNYINNNKNKYGDGQIDEAINVSPHLMAYNNYELVGKVKKKLG